MRLRTVAVDCCRRLGGTGDGGGMSGTELCPCLGGQANPNWVEWEAEWPEKCLSFKLPAEVLDIVQATDC